MGGGDMIAFQESSMCPAVATGLKLLDKGLPTDLILDISQQVRRITDELIRMEKMPPDVFFAYIESLQKTPVPCP